MLLASCHNKLDLNAPYKEMPAVYAVLNPQDSLQMIRINKVFLGEGDANVTAKVADSVNYGPGELSVYLTRSQYGQHVNASVQSDVLYFKEQMVTTGEGAFARQQRVYVTTERLYTTGDYTLTIHNEKTGNTFRAKAASVGPVAATIFPFFPNLRIPYPHDSITVYENANYYIKFHDRKTTISFSPLCPTSCGCALVPCGDKLYQLLIRVHFYDSTVTGNKYDYVDYNFSSKAESSKVIVASQPFIRYEFTPTEFFSAMGAALAAKNLNDNLIGRKIYVVEFFAYAATQEYSDFLLYNSPSFGINQQPPIYSNFENRGAIGIFTFRSRMSSRKMPATDMIDAFSTNPNTCRYRFLDRHGIYLGCQ